MYTLGSMRYNLNHEMDKWRGSYSLTSQLPYTTARLSLSPFTYIFHVTAGQKFIRLYFYPSSYPNFDRSKALFSVKARPFTLLTNFNAKGDDNDPEYDTLYKEFCVNKHRQKSEAEHNLHSKRFQFVCFHQRS